MTDILLDDFIVNGDIKTGESTEQEIVFILESNTGDFDINNRFGADLKLKLASPVIRNTEIKKIIKETLVTDGLREVFIENDLSVIEAKRES
jgi:hypothetical protein